MSWHPNDLVNDADLLAYERSILTQFGQVDWQNRRLKALEDWLFPLLANQGLDPQRLRTRYAPEAVLGSTSGVFSDYTSEATSQGTNDLPLATIMAAGTDALYVGSASPFRGFSLRMEDQVSTAAAVLTVSVWTDTWTPLPVQDETQDTAGKPFSRGGAITWRVPGDWVRREVDGDGPFYWGQLKLSAVPTGAAGGQLSVIRRSRLAAPVTFRTLALIFREAPTQQDGPWLAKAEWYEAEAERAWMRALPLIGGEFDSDNNDAIDASEANQTTDEASGGGWRYERY